MTRPLCLELRNLALQIGLSLFQHRAKPWVAALLEFLNHPLKRQAEALLFAEPTGLFPCQTRLCECGSCACIFLLRLDGLAFPAPSHGLIITRIDRLFERPCHPSLKLERSQTPVPGGLCLRKSKFAKIIVSPTDTCAYNSCRQLRQAGMASLHEGGESQEC